jgi:hypothetical protein
VRDTIAKGMQKVDWLNAKEVEVELNNFFTKDNSNSFYIWQWVSLGLLNN